jgi:hypothetical protein
VKRRDRSWIGKELLTLTAAAEPEPEPESQHIEPEPETEPGAQSRWIKPLSCYERRETTIVEGLRYG